MFKNKFVVIIGLCIVTLALLIGGAVVLYEDNSSAFLSDGYILSTTHEVNDKYYFSADTKYKKNVDENITFDDKESNSVVVDPASFIHYSNGNIGFLKKGAIVSLRELTNPIISYYNVNNDNVISYDNGSYSIETVDKTVSVESFAGRISDNKYIIAGKDLSLKVPDQIEEIIGDYFEVLFIEDGIVKIDNEDHSFQVTAQGTYFYVGNDIIINLGDGKISYNGEVKMLLSQITINGDENIDLAVNDKNSGGGGSGSGEGEGDGSGGTGDSTEANDGTGEGGGTGTGTGSGSGSGEGEGDGDGNGDGTGDGEGATGEAGEGATGEAGEGAGAGGTGSGEGEGTGGNGSGTGTGVTDNAKIELVSADVTTTSLSIKLLLNNAGSVNGTLKAYITNVSTGNDVVFSIDSKDTNIIELENGTFDILTSDTDDVEGTREFHLNPDTDYLLRIVAEENGNSNQYFQKIFRTKALGVSLEKMYATESTLKYKINFDDNSSVTDVNLNIKGGGISDSRKISINDNKTEVEFSGLDSNTEYSVYINNVTIKEEGKAGVNYASRYNINRTDSTLKEKPSAVGRVVGVTTDVDNARFTINLKNINDPDNSIVAYTYEVYLNDESGEVVYTATKNVSDNEKDDARELVLNVAELEDINAGVSYRCRVLVSYNNNEMIREISFDDGDAFSMKSIPSISWNSDDFVIGKYDASGSINLIDASCTIPIRGRSCSDNNVNYQIKDTMFTLKYYVVGEEEKTAEEVKFNFDLKNLAYDFDLQMLLSNTNYVMKVYGSYYDDKNVYHENVVIGNSVYFTTAKSDNLALRINGVNDSNDTNIVNFSMHLDKGTSTEKYEELVTSVSINLYNGAYNNPDKLIGNYTITDRGTIEDLFNSLTITNGLFTNLTDYSVGNCTANKICNRVALTNVTHNATNTLNSAYTIEIASVNVGRDKLVVENPLYTFVLTASYYLDARINANPNYNYVTVDEIVKGDLTEEQIEELRSSGISNIDELSGDTVVGLKISNNLSDLFVDSAFTYEKAVVNYTVYNSKTASIAKVVSTDMGNKYQPGEKIVWLDLTDTEGGFIRGYTYDVGYTIDFTIDSSGLTSDEDKNVVTYDNDVLHEMINIVRQRPVFTQYISSSTINSITYNYSMTDIDNSLYDKYGYYSYVVEGEDETEGETVEEATKNKFVADGKYHSIVLSIGRNGSYSFGYHYKKINDSGSANGEMDSHIFEGKYSYNNEVAYELINDVYDNKLKIVLKDNDVNSRAALYRVDLSASGVSDYSMMFLASKLDKYGEYVETEDSVDDRPKYIAIDYANISKFMKKDISVKVYAYYDTGLVGLNHNFDNGLIIKNIKSQKYLNIYNNGSQEVTSNKEEKNLMGINLLREAYNEEENSIYLYNLLMNASKYNNNIGANYYAAQSEISGKIGIKYGLFFSSQGLIINDGSKNYAKYNMNVVDVANLNGNSNSYRFDSITPKITVKTVNTINSFTIKMTASGLYSDSQFIKNGSSDNNLYIEVYSDLDCINKVKDLQAKIEVSANSSGSYSAVIDDVSMENLKPDTSYYFKIFAYINNKYTQLYDNKDSVNQYVANTYSTKTLKGSEILSRLNFSVKPSGYNGSISDKTITWRLGLRSLENYKIRFELYKPDGVESSINEDGETVEVVKYKAVKFDGTDATGCSTSNNGSSSNGYVNGCYISISKDEIKTINAQDQKYTFNTDDFVFGGNYYKLVIYAIPYTNGSYVEADKVVLYETDSLSSTDGDKNINGINYNIVIPTLKAPKFKLNDFESGYDATDGYFISFVPTCDDKLLDDGTAGSFVIKNGTYTAVLLDEKGNRVKTKSGISAGNANEEVVFDNLSPDKLYSVELSYENYRNNVGYTESEKVAIVPFSDFIYTPSSELGIRIGTVTPQKVSSNQIQLLYTGTVNLINKIVQVNYTITLKGTSGSKNTGSYKVDSDNSSIFSVERDHIIFNIDFSDVNSGHSDNTNFTLISGQTYVINTQYYYKNSAGEIELFDSNTSQLNT